MHSAPIPCLSLNLASTGDTRSFNIKIKSRRLCRCDGGSSIYPLAFFFRFEGCSLLAVTVEDYPMPLYDLL